MIVNAAINLGIANDHCYRFVDRNNHDFFSKTKITFQEMAKDQDSMMRFWNNHQICQLSRERKDPFLDCWEGVAYTTQHLYYFSSNRQNSLRRLIQMHRSDEGTAQVI